MSRFATLALLLWFALSVERAAAQSSFGHEPLAAEPASELSPSRLAAGVRAYPAGVVRALLTLAEDPLLLRQLAEEPEFIGKPEGIYPPLDPRMLAAVRELQRVPELVLVAAAYPGELAALRRLYAEAPEGIELRIAELNARYDAARHTAARAWQMELERTPEALAAYQELITRFCRAQLAQYAEFPCVEVTRRDYYLACPPNELIMAYAQHGEAGAALAGVLDRWWREFSPHSVDERVLAARGPVESVGGSSAVIDMRGAQRAAMWRVPDRPADLPALLPVIMQPLQDQPLEAQMALAVAEHARLWAPSIVVEEAPELPAVADADEWRPPADVRDWPAVVQVPPDDVGAQGVVVEDWPAWEQAVVDMGLGLHDAPLMVDPVTTVNVHYFSGQPYFYSYPWTWPVLYSSYPWFHRDVVCGTHLGFGRHARVWHGGSRSRVYLDIGFGTKLYYDCPAPRPVRHVSRRHRYWTNYGAPYGGPYWRNYGAPYGGRSWRDYGAQYRDRPGRAPERPRSLVIRTPDRDSPRRGPLAPPAISGLGRRLEQERVPRSTGRIGPVERRGDSRGIDRPPRVTTPWRGERTQRDRGRAPALGGTRPMRSGAARQPNGVTVTPAPARQRSEAIQPRVRGATRGPSVRPGPTAGPTRTHQAPGSSIGRSRPRAERSSSAPTVRPASPDRRSHRVQASRPARSANRPEPAQTGVRSAGRSGSRR